MATKPKTDYLVLSRKILLIPALNERRIIYIMSVMGQWPGDLIVIGSGRPGLKP